MLFIVFIFFLLLGAKVQYLKNQMKQFGKFFFGIMEQHPSCRCEFVDFKEANTLVVRCDVCFTLDGRTRTCITNAMKHQLKVIISSCEFH